MPCRDELFCAPSCGRAWPRLPDSYDCSNKDCCTNGSRSWKAENQGHAAPHADHAGHRKTNSFAVAGVRQNWRWHPRITDVRFWGKADMARCPLFPRKQTFAIMIRMSALCQKRTSRALLGASETIVFFSSTGAAGGAEITLVSSKEALGRNYKLDPRLSASVQCLSA